MIFTLTQAQINLAKNLFQCCQQTLETLLSEREEYYTPLILEERLAFAGFLANTERVNPNTYVVEMDVVRMAKMLRFASGFALALKCMVDRHGADKRTEKDYKEVWEFVEDLIKQGNKQDSSFETAIMIYGNREAPNNVIKLRPKLAQLPH